jgi:hypothetical protein
MGGGNNAESPFDLGPRRERVGIDLGDVDFHALAI